MSDLRKRKKKPTIPQGFKKIFYGAYIINRSGKILRWLAAPSTYRGRPITPYPSFPEDTELKVSLQYKGKRKQILVSKLVARTFRK